MPFGSTHGDGLEVSSSQVPSKSGPSTTPYRLQGPAIDWLVYRVMLLSRFSGLRPGGGGAGTESPCSPVQLKRSDGGSCTPIVYMSQVLSIGLRTILGLCAKGTTATLSLVYGCNHKQSAS